MAFGNLRQNEGVSTPDWDDAFKGAPGGMRAVGAVALHGEQPMQEPGPTVRERAITALNWVVDRLVTGHIDQQS